MLSLKECQKLINLSLDSIDLPGEPSNLYDPIKYILEIGGKRLRPSLVIMACNVYQDNVQDALFPALALEVFHNFTLMHDDIMDNSFLRRNYPTVHVKWNRNIGILSGDAMVIKAYQLLSMGPEKILPDLIRIFNSTALRLCEGQQYDLDFEERIDISIDDYLKMIKLKTAALIAGSLEMGAFIGGADELHVRKFHEIGQNLGIAFQIQDDWLDLYAEEKGFGKITGNDIVNNKKTALLIQALQMSEGERKNELLSWIEKRDFIPEDKVIAVKAIFNDLKIKESTLKLVEKYYNKAISCLDEINVKAERKKELYSFAVTLMERKA